MSSIRNYQISKEAIRMGRKHGLYGDTEKRLRRMARRSAPVTSKYGNRRFNDFYLLIADDTVKAVTRLYS